MTRGVAFHCQENLEASFQMLECLQRHARGDWGDVCDEDKQANDRALKNGDERILSAYSITGKKIWIITEWDRSVTTVLFPEEY
jgi:hypothetical protein